MFNLTDSLNLLDELINACDLKTQEAIDLQSDYDCNGFSWAKYEAVIAEYTGFVTPNLILLKDSLITLQNRYLQRCQEMGIKPSEDAPLNFEDLIELPGGSDNDEICTCDQCNPDNKIDYEDNEE